MSSHLLRVTPSTSPSRQTTNERIWQPERSYKPGMVPDIHGFNVGVTVPNPSNVNFRLRDNKIMDKGNCV